MGVVLGVCLILLGLLLILVDPGFWLVMARGAWACYRSSKNSALREGKILELDGRITVRTSNLESKDKVALRSTTFQRYHLSRSPSMLCPRLMRR